MFFLIPKRRSNTIASPFAKIALRVAIGLVDSDPRLAVLGHGAEKIHLNIVRLEIRGAKASVSGLLAADDFEAKCFARAPTQNRLVPRLAAFGGSG